MNSQAHSNASCAHARAAAQTPDARTMRPGRRAVVMAAGLAPFGLALLCRSARVVAAEGFTARVENIPDGDSLTVRTTEGRRLKIRLAGIDSPEIGQPHAQAARDHLRRRIGEDAVAIHPVKTDVYGRLVARVFQEREDLALLQVAQGYAWHFERYASEQTPHEQRLYRTAQAAARERRLGLWRDPDPVPPWDYRSAERRR